MNSPATEPPPLPLKLRGVTKAFGKTIAVDDVSLDLHPGELLGLVGPSGCGKSTLLRLIAGLERIDSGTIEVGCELVDDGRKWTDPEQRGVGLVFQDHALFPHLTVADNVGFGLRRRSAIERQTEVVRLLNLVGLEHLAKRYPHEVSGGERQRVSLARALAPGPRLLLLDEPFASLDPNRRTQVRSDLISLLRAAQTPAVLVTHDQTEALAVGDRVAVMCAGQIQQVGAPLDVYARPVNRFVAGFMGEARFLPLTAASGGLVTELGPVVGDSAAAANSLAVVRPSDVDLEVDPAGTAVIERAEYRGATWSYEIRLASDLLVLSTQPRSVVAPAGTRVHPRLATHHDVVIIPADEPPET